MRDSSNSKANKETSDAFIVKMRDSRDSKANKETRDVFIVRLENLLSTVSQSVDIGLLFPGREIREVIETTLDGNLPLDQLQRLKWKSRESERTGIKHSGNFNTSLPKNNVIL